MNAQITLEIFDMGGNVIESVSFSNSGVRAAQIRRALASRRKISRLDASFHKLYALSDSTRLLRLRDSDRPGLIKTAKLFYADSRLENRFRLSENDNEFVEVFESPFIDSKNWLTRGDLGGTVSINGQSKWIVLKHDRMFVCDSAVSESFDAAGNAVEISLKHAKTKTTGNSVEISVARGEPVKMEFDFADMRDAWALALRKACVQATERDLLELADVVASDAERARANEDQSRVRRAIANVEAFVHTPNGKKELLEFAKARGVEAQARRYLEKSENTKNDSLKALIRNVFDEFSSSKNFPYAVSRAIL